MSNASLPAAPLATAIERLISFTPGADDARGRACERFYLNPRTLYAWRTGAKRSVTLAVADRILSASPYLWFDVWPECLAHETPLRSCADCLTYYRARRAFTGRRVPESIRSAR